VILGQGDEGERASSRTVAAGRDHEPTPPTATLLLLADTKAGVVASVHASRPARAAGSRSRRPRPCGRSARATSPRSWGIDRPVLLRPLRPGARRLARVRLAVSLGASRQDLARPQGGHAAQLTEAGRARDRRLRPLHVCRADWSISSRRDGDETGKVRGDGVEGVMAGATDPTSRRSSSCAIPVVDFPGHLRHRVADQPPPCRNVAGPADAIGGVHVHGRFERFAPQG